VVAAGEVPGYLLVPQRRRSLDRPFAHRFDAKEQVGDAETVYAVVPGAAQFATSCIYGAEQQILCHKGLGGCPGGEYGIANATREKGDYLSQMRLLRLAETAKSLTPHFNMQYVVKHLSPLPAGARGWGPARSSSEQATSKIAARRKTQLSTAAQRNAASGGGSSSSSSSARAACPCSTTALPLFLVLVSFGRRRPWAYQLGVRSLHASRALPKWAEVAAYIHILYMDSLWHYRSPKWAAVVLTPTNFYEGRCQPPDGSGQTEK
jgi:hypothetical protein